MKTSIDKKQISVADYPKVKKEVKKFKERYTDGDLAHFGYEAIAEKYNQITGERYPWSSDVIMASVNAFDYDDFHGTYFRVELLLDGYGELCKVSYYTNLDLEINTNASWNRFEGKFMYTFGVERWKHVDGSERILYSDNAI